MAKLLRAKREYSDRKIHFGLLCNNRLITEYESRKKTGSSLLQENIRKSIKAIISIKTTDGMIYL